LIRLQGLLLISKGEPAQRKPGVAWRYTLCSVWLLAFHLCCGRGSVFQASRVLGKSVWN